MRTIEIEGEEVEVSEEDYQQFLMDQRESGTAQLLQELMMQLKGAIETGNLELLQRLTETNNGVVSAISNIKQPDIHVAAPEIPAMPAINIPKSEVFIPEPPRIKEIKVTKVVRDDQDLISGCTLKVVYS